jgi:hypothetical protein
MEATEFVRDAKDALDEASRDIAAAPRDPDAAVRKRAATLPPAPMARRPPTVPPPSDKATLGGAPARFASTVLGVSGRSPAPANKQKAGSAAELRRGSVDGRDQRPAGSAAEWRRGSIDDEASETRPLIEWPRTEQDADDLITDPTAAPIELGDGWRDGLAARIDAALDDEFGADTPVKAPTRAELQALTDAPPDATRLQSLEELERLKRATTERASTPDLMATRRSPHPTAEVDDSDIEAAIELAPPARRTAVGVAKKKKPAE